MFPGAPGGEAWLLATAITPSRCRSPGARRSAPIRLCRCESGAWVDVETLATDAGDADRADGAVGTRAEYRGRADPRLLNRGDLGAALAGCSIVLQPAAWLMDRSGHVTSTAFADARSRL